MRAERNPTGSVLVIEVGSLLVICGPTTSIDLPYSDARRLTVVSVVVVVWSLYIELAFLRQLIKSFS